MAGHAELGDVYRPAIGQVRARDAQHAGAGVVGGAGEGDRDVGGGYAVTCEVCHGYRCIGTGCPVFCGSQVVGGAALAAGAVFVQSGLEGVDVGGVECDGEAGATGDLHTGAGERVAGAVASDAQLADVDVVGGAVQLQEARASDHQLTCGTVIGGAGDGRDGDIAGGDAVAGQVGDDDGRLGADGPILGGGEVVGSGAGGTGAILVDDLVDGGLVSGIQGEVETSAEASTYVGTGQGVSATFSG